MTALATGSGLTIEDCRTVASDQVRGWVASTDVAAVRVVLPGAAVVCRTVPLGDDADALLLEQRLDAALADRPVTDAPFHRSTQAVLPPIDGTTSRSGIVLAWPEDDATTLPTLDVTPLAVPDVVGLLAVASTGDPAAWIDPGGSISLVLQGRELVARCVREADPVAALPGVLQESAMLAESGAVSLPSNGPLRLSDTARARLQASCTSPLPEDLDTFGVAIACAVAAVGPLAPLTTLQQDAPVFQISRTQRAVNAMRTPKTAAAIVALAIGTLFLGPILTSGVRLAALQAAHPDLAAAVDAAGETESRNQYYGVMSKEVWPMTKLLSDIGAAAPLGIVFEQIRIDHGEPVRIKGHATPRGGESAADLITRMKADLQQSGVFRDVTVEWDGKKRIGQREFTIVAGVRDAQRRPRYVDDRDFAAWTHQQRRFDLPKTADGGPPARPSELSGWTPIAPGASAAATTPSGNTSSSDSGAAAAPVNVADAGAPSTPTAPSGSGSDSRPPRDGRPYSPRGDREDAEPVDPSTIVREAEYATGDRPVDRPGGSGSASSSGSSSVGSAEFQSGDLDSGALGAMPQILSDEQLATLSEDELRTKLSEVTTARERIKDPEQSAQLRDYFKRIFDRLREVRRQGQNP
ncbi:MAG: hypothetical protein MK074_01515 [Phycisphaerales bacterium]|nr:hypothetical protein [Phycisphaerales bacterium]